MRVLERICLVVALAACAFLLLERFEVIDIQASSRRRARSRLVSELEGELSAGLEERIRAGVLSESAALQARLATDLEQKLTGELVPALKVELSEELGAGAGTAPESVTARELNITNAEGKVVIRLTANASGGGELTVSRDDGRRIARLYARADHDGELDLYDENAVIRANIGGNVDGGYSNFWNRSGDTAVYLGADAESESGYVAVYGPGEKRVIELLSNDRGGVFTVRGLESGRTIATLGAAGDTGTGYLGLGSPDGTTGVALYTTTHGGQVKVLNNEGSSVAFLGVSADPEGNGLLYVANKAGQRIMEAGANTSFGGYVSLRNSKDKRVLFMGSSTGTSPDDGVIEVETAAEKLGVVLRAYAGGSSVRVYDDGEKVKSQLR